MPRIPMSAAALMAVAASVAAFAGGLHDRKQPEPTTFIALLNAGQATSMPEVSGTGVAFATFDEKTKEFCFSLSYDDPLTMETAAHIHGPGLPGENAPVIFDFSDPPGSPKRLCFGPVKPKQRRQLRAGLWYFNVHSEEYIHGEIRGQIVPVSAP